MRTLLLMRGAPGAGKSTWIKNHNLQDYTLCPDELRVLCASKDFQPDGTFKIAQERENEKKVWSLLFDLLEYRMSRGDFTVIDATCSKTKDMQQYRDLAEHYRYRTYIVGFTKVPLETCLQQNKQRPEEKWVPEAAIKNIYARFATQAIPARLKVIQPDEFDSILEEPFDASEYRKLVFIGDIHGCYDTLMQYPDFKNGLKDDTEYIFCGDFIDRGNQNAEVMKFLNSIMDKPNVCLLEGNHEKYLQNYGDGIEAKSGVFERKTKPQLIAGGYDEKMARMFYRKVRQFSHLLFHGFEILACHGGIPNLNKNLLYIPTHKFVHGVGEYDDYTTNAESWMSQTKDNCYLIHGHRNTDGSEIQMADRVFNLEGRIEFGGKIRIVECEFAGQYPEYGITEDGQRIALGMNEAIKWNTIELDDCQPVDENLLTEERHIDTVEDAIQYMRNNRFIVEKDLGDGISSFNFTREAFMKGNWNKQTILARGLFIDTINNKIMARSYEKFFKVGEVAQTDLAVLREKLQFPVQAYVKENGFLAIVSYDYNNDDLFIASKSTNKGDYVEYIKAQLEPYREKLLENLRAHYNFAKALGDDVGLSYVFECEDIEHDPHIIKYDKNKIVLLDVICNTLDFAAADYEMVVNTAKIIGCPVKEKAFELKDWDDFRTLYSDVQEEEYKYNDRYIEGFVFVDANGFMTKCKTAYYNEWKKLRGVADQTLRCGYITRTGMLTSALENSFYGFCKDIYNNHYNKETKTYPFKTDIISLRGAFLKGAE